ncbi:hypothetical protein PsYK624_008140 [Phanerochaete sordida]|uniref:Uncharacterized protein n=1 Tax=Phanerochaete sordida TaxID=48140 RepID=A0A9P3FX56_9APHY|nr:hypothetical protein PsYK624_008140 [Phanerochaete sordida]
MQPILSKARAKARIGGSAPASQLGDEAQEDRTVQFEAAAAQIQGRDISTTGPPAFTSHILQLAVYQEYMYRQLWSSAGTSFVRNSRSATIDHYCSKADTSQLFVAT